MKIIMIGDDGNPVVKRCRKIEPATLSRSRQIIVDECEVIDVEDIVKIVEG